MPRQKGGFGEQMRRALNASSGTFQPLSETGRREDSLRGLASMVRLSNVRHATPAGNPPSEEPALADKEEVIRRANLLADAIEMIDKLGLSREDAASKTCLSLDDLDLLLQGNLARFDEATLTIVLGRLAGGVAMNVELNGDSAREQA